MANYFKSFLGSIKHWYIPLIIGILFIALGVYVLTTPLETYLTLSIFFSMSFVFSGLLDVVFSIQNRDTINGWGWYLVGGLLTLAMGAYLLINPEVSMAILPFVVGFTLLFRSFQLMGYAFDLRDMKALSWGNVALLSVGGILLSLGLIASPLFTGISLVVLTSISFMVIGITSIMLSLSLKKVKDLPGKVSDELKSKIQSVQSEIEQYIKSKTTN